MEEGFDVESVSSCQAAEDVGLRSSSVTFFTHDSGTVTSPTVDLPPSSETSGFAFKSTASAHLWGRQAVLKHDLSLNESYSAPSQSDLSGNTPLRPGLILDDKVVEFVGELDSAFADVSMSSAQHCVRNGRHHVVHRECDGSASAFNLGVLSAANA